MNRIHLRARIHARRLQISTALLAVIVSLGLAATASASRSQVAVIQDGNAYSAAADAQQFHAVGAKTLRLLLQWYTVAPKANAKHAPHFNQTNPGAYPAGNWSQWDNAIKAASAAGMTVDLDIVGGPPRWAQGKGVPSKFVANHFGWNVNARDYGKFVTAVAKRYSGHYTPNGASSALPKVSLYSLWNEPNMGQQLGPQNIDATRHSNGYSIAPLYYRNLLRSGYAALKRHAPHGSRIMIGELAGSGRSHNASKRFPQGLPGQTAITYPIEWVQTLYCLNSHYHRLTGRAAQVAGCPKNGHAARSFVKQNPALFGASAFSVHPYASKYAPTVKASRVPKGDVILPTIGRLVTEMGKVTRAWHHAKRFEIWSTEYGFVTSPPQKGGHHYPTPAKAAIYLNQSEYMSYKNRSVASYAQYLLTDPPNPTEKGGGLFASGLVFSDGSHKPGYDAYRLPLWMPQQTVKRGARAEVWGGARPAVFSSSASTVEIQQRSAGAWNTLATEKVNRSNGYFDTHLKFRAGGSVRLAYTYPAADPFLPVGDAGTTVYSRTLKVRTR